MSGGPKPVNPDVTTKSFPICCSRANASADATNCTICDSDTWPVGRYSAWSPIILKYCNSLIGILLASCRPTLTVNRLRRRAKHAGASRLDRVVRRLLVRSGEKGDTFVAGHGWTLL